MSLEDNFMETLTLSMERYFESFGRDVDVVKCIDEIAGKMLMCQVTGGVKEIEKDLRYG